MDYPWIIHGLSMDYPWIIHGLSMDYPWIIHGISMDNPWIILGYSMDYPWAGPATMPFLNSGTCQITWLISQRQNFLVLNILSVLKSVIS